MKDVEEDVVLNEVIKELSEKYNKKEKIIKIMLEKSIVLGYDIVKSKENIIKFMDKTRKLINS